MKNFLINTVREKWYGPVVCAICGPIILLVFNVINYLLCFKNKTLFKPYWGGTIKVPAFYPNKIEPK